MPCPTCSETMQLVFMDRERTVHHCPRCGTLRSELLGHIDDSVPKLVDRCRAFSAELSREAITQGVAAGLRRNWHRLGIRESLHSPKERPDAP